MPEEPEKNVFADFVDRLRPMPDNKIRLLTELQSRATDSLASLSAVSSAEIDSPEHEEMLALQGTIREFSGKLIEAAREEQADLIGRWEQAEDPTEQLELEHTLDTHFLGWRDEAPGGPDEGQRIKVFEDPSEMVEELARRQERQREAARHSAERVREGMRKQYPEGHPLHGPMNAYVDSLEQVERRAEDLQAAAQQLERESE